ncbi:hypothetical protein IM711_02405 [Microbacterium esteraromaticum]|uniref:hypothetical protein n=1 Tax=Microbacterium esteraromaticum TaxID=57043 RepID=UPI003C2E8888
MHLVAKHDRARRLLFTTDALEQSVGESDAAAKMTPDMFSAIVIRLFTNEGVGA